jgi:predicted AlkP superfamily pyrophosphatase or phosphodiesterase
VKFIRIIFPLLLLVLIACAPGIGLTPLETATQLPVPREATATLTAIPPMATSTSTPRPLAKRVIIISFDGLRPDAIKKAPMKNLIAMMQTSAYTLSAQTILPSSTLPSHASMLSGLCPAKHGVYWNDYVPENGYALGTNLFDLAHAAGLRTVMIVGKEKLRQIAVPESTDVFVFKEMDSSIGSWAVTEIKQGFDVMFIHFPNGDEIGHEWGWMGGVQMSAYRTEDAYLGKILTTLDDAGLRDGTLIILTSDHGGLKTSHGGDLLEETTIPWIVNGPGVVAGPLTSFVQTTDTAATAAYMLGLPLPAEWDGQPVYEAFGQPTPVRVYTACQQTH